MVVEVNLFCPFYGEQQWRLSPMNAINNVNGIGRVGRDEVYALDKHGDLLEVQEAMTRKVVAELTRLTERERVRREQPLIEPLSPRELEVLVLLGESLSNQEIADRLHIAPGTAKNHVSNILSKLGV